MEDNIKGMVKRTKTNKSHWTTNAINLQEPTEDDIIEGDTKYKEDNSEKDEKKEKVEKEGIYNKECKDDKIGKKDKHVKGSNRSQMMSGR